MIPVLVICPECGKEISRMLIYGAAKTYILPQPRTCPDCDTWLGPKIRATPGQSQVRLCQ